MDQGLPLSTIAEGTSTLSAEPARNKEFDSLVFVSDNIAKLPETAEPKAYYSMEDVAEDFASADEEYKAANIWFSNSKIKALGKPFKVFTYDDTETPVLVDGLNLLAASTDEYYFLSVASGLLTDSGVGAVASWAASHKPCLFAYTSLNIDCTDSTKTTDVMSTTKLLAVDNAMICYHDTDKLSHIAACAYIASVNLMGIGSSYTLHGKTTAGIAAIKLKVAQHKAITDKKGSVYALVRSMPMWLNGFTSSGNYVDEIHQQDWLNDQVQVELVNLVRRVNKIPQTEKGMDMAKTEVEKALIRGTDNGCIAPGIYTGQSIGHIEQGSYLRKGYDIYTAPVSQQSQADRIARKSVLIQYVSTLSGAIHKFSFDGLLIR